MNTSMSEPPPLKRKITLKVGGNPGGAAANPAGAVNSSPDATNLDILAAPVPPVENGSVEANPKIRLITAPRKPLPSGPTHTNQGVGAVQSSGSVQSESLPPVRTKTGRITKPSAKKRAKDEARLDEEGENVPHANGATGSEPVPKRIRVIKTPISATRPPTLKLRTTGRIPFHPPGDGYDSEAEDRELDPVIEEQIILRMMPGKACDYIRKSIQERKIGLPRQQGGADITLKWVDDEGRRCAVGVAGELFAAVLVDLPTITESTKTWDKKSLIKAADICQMLLVFERVNSEEEVKQIPLPKAIEKGYRWPHGLTPPMHDCIHRRFRKRLSKLEIQNKEAEVERLLKADQEAMSTKWEFVDERQQAHATGHESQLDYEDEYEEEEDEEEEEEEELGEEDAEGIADEEAEDYFGDAAMAGGEDDFNVDDAVLEAEFEAQVSDAMAGTMDAPTSATSGQLDVNTPISANALTPAAQTNASGVDEEADEDEDSEEDEGDDGNVEDDDEDGARHDEVAAVRAEIAQMKKQLADLEGQLARSVQPLMKRRIDQNIRNLKAEVELKKSSIGEVDDD
ncbi:hypothetical protein VTK73DRAFT_9519 [Phialemonium thermophilum]|uniref:TAFII55 protein conserved region domain-containing protein n=1 Tax=Phialemonium thermophilum TaxID=223376 RepID=A0ABR3Y5S5_9PEZI